MQVAQTSDIGYIYGGRVVSGLGLGMVSNLAPVYMAECAPRHLRGVLVGLFQLCLVAGGMLACVEPCGAALTRRSYFITYGASLHLTGDVVWRLPLGFQAVPAGIMVRWLGLGRR